MSSLDLTRDWLKNVLKPYPARERLVSEVIDILTQRRTLSVKTDAFTFDNGQTALLLLLHGTLPITFRGATYQIPLHVWVPLEYPRAPPLAFVVPTKEMGVRKGREVEPGGRVTGSVVETWWNSWESKTIEMLLRQLTSVFSATPPVYSKPPEPAGQQPNGQSSRPSSGYARPSRTPSAQPPPQPAQPPPPPARPYMGPSPVATESLPRYQSEQTPPPHPFPQQRIPQPQGGHSRQNSMPPQSPPVPNRPVQAPPRAGSQGPGSPGSGPILPQRPYIPQPAGYPPSSPVHAGPSYHDPRYTTQQASHQHMSAGGSGPGPYMSGQPTYTHPQQPQPQMPPQQQSPYQYPGQGPPHPPASTAPPPQQTTSPPPAPVPQAATKRQMEDLLSSPDQPTTSLPSTADTGAPPPIPPSKPPPPSLLHLHSILLPHLQASLPSIVHSLQSNKQHLIDRHEDLVSGEPAIRDEMARLEAVKKVCDSVGRKLGDAVNKGQERVAELEARGEVDVDEVVCSISIVHNQLIDLVAEDNAIEDTIYHMTRALDNERIDLDRYMKSIRMLAREQYMKRALIERILQGMGQTQGW